MVTRTVTGFSLNGERPVAGRAIVFHAENGDKVGCGIITPSAAKLTIIGGYPGYSGELAIKGLLHTMDTPAGLRLGGTLTGLEAGVTGGWHVHGGFTCDDADGVFGHYTLS